MHYFPTDAAPVSLETTPFIHSGLLDAIDSLAMNIDRAFVKPAVFLDLRTFARKFSNIDFFLQILPLKDDELVMSEM